MFGQKYFTLENFPYNDAIELWKNVIKVGQYISILPLPQALVFMRLCMLWYSRLSTFLNSEVHCLDLLGDAH